MHEARLLHTLFENSLLTCVHRKRLNALFTAVSALYRGANLTITDLGRQIGSKVADKHNIKRMFNLMNNTQLNIERPLFYQVISTFLYRSSSHCVVIVDWSQLTEDDQYYVVRASVPFEGRSITLYEEVHKSRCVTHQQTNQRFLRRLKALLPDALPVVIVTDAGFYTPWFQEVERLGWDWIGRVRGPTHCQLGKNSVRQACKSLYNKATYSGKYLGACLLTKKHKHSCHLYLIKKRKKGRKKLHKTGKEDKRGLSKRCGQREKEPWLLASSIGGHEHKGWVINRYRTRMQCEENFRDTKDPKYGLGLSASGTRDKFKLENLLLIAAIATLFQWLVGYIAEKNNKHYAFQANTVKDRRVLSLVYLGYLIIRRGNYRIETEQIIDLMEHMSEIIGEKNVSV